MSYSCEISFKQISGDDVYAFLQTFKKATTEHLEEIAEDNYVFSPIMREKPVGVDTVELTPELFASTKNWARNSVFHHRFFYNKELQLLGVYSVHNSLQNLFDCTVYFQNSCDQDYEYSEWRGVKYFEEVVEKWKNKSDDEVKTAFKARRSEDWDSEYCSDLEYYKRAFVYEEIWKNFENTLEDDSSVLYLSLFGFYDSEALGGFVRLCKQKVIKFIEECNYGKG